MLKLTQDLLIMQGKSGRNYHFKIYSSNEECPNESGVYVFTKRDKFNNQYSHFVVYIGIATSFQKHLYNHQKIDCIKEQGANTICLMEVLSEADRVTIEKDLLAVNNTPCNETYN